MLKRTYLKLVEMQEEQARRHLDEVRSIHSEMRGYKHDFHHHLQTLKGQLEAGEVDRAIAYIEQLDRNLQGVDTLLKTGNVTVDAILSAKIAQARAEGIALTVQANLPRELTLSDLELSIVIGNLLDNAIRAAAQALPPEVYVRIRKTPEEYLLSVRNRVQDDLDLEDNKLPGTTKKESGHGMGFANVQEVLRKYGAEYTVSCRDRWFRFTCAIPVCNS